MNKTFKVIFSRTRGKYVVADELVKSAGKGALCAVALAVAATSVLAADKDVVDKGAQAIAYDISPQNDGTNIAIGKNAKVFIGGGTQESALSFGEAVSTSWTGSMNIHSNSAAKQNLPAGIAIGTNTYARTGSIQIGDHTLEKNKIAIGDATADKLRQFGVAATTLGTNSYTGGGFATTIGSYNVQSSPYEASGVTDTFINSTKNAFATVIGTLNSNESMAGNSSSGVANYLGGVANKVTNSNGAVVIGAGNTVKESSDYIDSSAYATHAASVTEMQQAMIDGVRQSSGGATLVFGGGNQAEYTQASQLIGVSNTLTGTSGSVSQYNALNGYKNTAENVKQTYITGIENSVYNSLQVKVLGDNNTVSKSNYQTVIGDNNSVANRDAGTTSGKNRTNPDLWIGAGNSIDGNDTYQSGYETLKTIGNHNKFVNAGSGIVIGDYQTIYAAKESVVIGSMSPDEQADETTFQKANSVVIGYHAQSGSRDSGGLNVVLGNRAKAYGWVQTVTGIGSVAGVKDDFTSGYLATSYGALNKIDGTESFANSVVGTLNKTDDAAGALVLGSGNTVSHSSLDVVAPELGQIVTAQSQYLALGDSSYLSYDTTVDIMGKMMSAGGGSVSTIGHGNTADYASLSQIFGSGNILKGAAGNISERNTISGSYNTGADIKNTSLIGTGNTVSGSQNDVVIGDYHTLSGGGNNVVIGSMETQDQQVTKTVKAGSQDISYTVTEKVPVKPHQSNISDTVMIGHNADVTVNGGVALGANSVASTDKGVAGYDLSTGAASTESSVAWKSTAAAVSVGDVDNGITRQITGVAAGLNDTDAVNVAQLKKATSAATTTVNTTDPNMTITERPADSHNYTVGLNKNLTGMESAEFGAGTSVTKISKDGLKIVKDDTTVQLTSGGLDNGGQRLRNIAAGEQDSDGVNLQQLKNSISKVESGDPSYVTVGVRKEHPANNSGATIYSVALTNDADDAITKANHYLTATGINAQGDKITNVAPGSISATSTDAVNGSQLYQVQQGVNQNAAGIGNLTHRINDLDGQIDKVGASAAALAALHPVDFDPDHRFQMSMGLGHYKSREGVAVGAFWYPTDTGNLLLSVGYSASASDNRMVNAGLTYRFGGDGAGSESRQSMAQKVSTLTAENRSLSAKLTSSNMKLEATTSKLEATTSKLEAATSKIDSLMARIRAIESKLNMQ